jgi:hypothetical protein
MRKRRRMIRKTIRSKGKSERRISCSYSFEAIVWTLRTRNDESGAGLLLKIAIFEGRTMLSFADSSFRVRNAQTVKKY